jgi:hypothetical protein
MARSFDALRDTKGWNANLHGVPGRALGELFQQVTHSHGDGRTRKRLAAFSRTQPLAYGELTILR